ncbi:uncharacterized protein [Rutidosis leptorrhynchoides]|uniref:uncharacterized protein n=1 Tax=Rutidosis leptorrhynchoides TaxID=125765 RepID=UPI003A99C9BA
MFLDACIFDPENDYMNGIESVYFVQIILYHEVEVELDFVILGTKEPENNTCIVDSGALRHMTGHLSLLSNIHPIKGGYVAFAGDKGGHITAQGLLRNEKVSFDKVNYCQELANNLLSVSQICEKSFKVAFDDEYSYILKPEFVIPPDMILMKAPRQADLYMLDMNGKQSKKAHKLVKYNPISAPPELLHMDVFGPICFESIDGNRKNRVLIETARTMLADSSPPVHFWREAVSNACYTMNRNAPEVSAPNKSPDPTPSVIEPLQESDQDPIYDTYGSDISSESSENPEDMGDTTNLHHNIPVPAQPVPKTTATHPRENIIGDPNACVRTRRQVMAMQEEIQQFHWLDVWKLVTKPNGVKVIDLKWVWKNKYDEDGNVIRNKVRLVAKGYQQNPEFDYDEVFAPVARLEAIRIFLAFASFMKFKVYQMDVKNHLHPDTVYHLRRALYGLHQAPRAWYGHLSSYLIEKGYQMGMVDCTLFTKTDNGIFLHQEKYVNDILEWFFMTQERPVSTLLAVNHGISLDCEGEPVDPTYYRVIIRSLMYLTASMSDIMFATCLCARYQVNLNTVHLTAAKRILRYLLHSPNLGICDTSNLMNRTSDSLAARVTMLPARFVLLLGFISMEAPQQNVLKFNPEVQGEQLPNPPINPVNPPV